MLPSNQQPIYVLKGGQTLNPQAYFYEFDLKQILNEYYIYRIESENYCSGEDKFNRELKQLEEAKT